MNCSSDTQSILDTLQAMCQQEEEAYKTTASLHQNQPPQSSSAHVRLDLAESAVTVECHNKMVAWCYGIADYCKFQRETVAIAVNYLDRFLASGTPTGHVARTDRKVFQLAAMTSLYTAVKMHEPEVMDPRTVSNLSRGAYSAQDVQAMEQFLLPALQWRLNPPTALSFVRLYLQLLLPQNVLTRPQREAVYDLAKFQTELAVAQYDFVNVAPSLIAYGALVNALESLGMENGTLQYTTTTIAQAVPTLTAAQSDVIFEVQNWLYMAISNQPACQAMAAAPSNKSLLSTCPAKSSPLSSVEVSPRSISAAQ